ncbi:LOW QUALITY PROTEIN: titin homolog [Nilaparvata lugens]|uniref:LOW QUALITY PROTEIN: titin homolog n=1 Tax=Nilaparvata lugens TaxID=108931 RepID=UPI00193E65A9|nr:LOW QUALITY PROTEIN: titin homolog [Nilaparvata lugens]
MASENEASRQSCASDPNFAVICSFLERFAEQCGIPHPAFSDLQEMIENTEQVSQSLIDLHIKLLRKARKTFSTEKWERTLVRFCQPYSPEDAWDLERYGYMNTKVDVRLRLLKILLDAQFDYNLKFKTDINKLEAHELRSEPLGRDKLGCNYWCQLDPTANVRVYKEDQEEETWELVAKDREGLISLITELSAGENIEGIEEFLNEDSNSQDLEMNPVLDTGQESDENEHPTLKNGIAGGEELNESKVSETKEQAEPKNGGSDEKSNSIVEEEESKPLEEDKTITPSSQKPGTETDNKQDSSAVKMEVGEENGVLEAASEAKTDVSPDTTTNSDIKPKLETVEGENSSKEKSVDENSASVKVEDENIKSESLEVDQQASHQRLESGNSQNATEPDKTAQDTTAQNSVSSKSEKGEVKCEQKVKDEKYDAQKSLKKEERLDDKLAEIEKQEKDGPGNAEEDKPAKPKEVGEASKEDKPAQKLTIQGSTTSVDEKVDKKTKDPDTVCKDLEQSSTVSTESVVQPKDEPKVKPDSQLVEQSVKPKDESKVKLDLPSVEQSVKPKDEPKAKLDSPLVEQSVKPKDEPKVKLDSPLVEKSDPNKSGIASKPALNLSREPAGPSLKDSMQSKLSKTLGKEVDLSCSPRGPTKNLLDVTEELKQRSALLKSGSAAAFKGKDGKAAAPGSILDGIFKNLKRTMTNPPESQPLPAHFIGTSKNLLLEKMRMNETLNLSRYSDSGKFSQPPNNTPYISKDVEDLSMGVKRPCPEDLSVHSAKKAHVEDRKLEPMVSEAIEEPIMLVKGEGSGRDCDTGNLRHFHGASEKFTTQQSQFAVSEAIEETVMFGIDGPRILTEQSEFAVGEAIEEPVMLILGEGSGIDCDTGNMGNKSPVTSNDDSEQSEFIVGEAIEEPLMFVTGEGSGIDCDTGNMGNKSPVTISNDDTEQSELFIVGEAIEEPVMFFTGEGSGIDCDTGNMGNKSPVTISNDDTEQSEFIVGEAIEEPLMLILGEGSGRDCDTGNVDKESASVDKEKQMETTEKSAVENLKDSSDSLNDSENKSITENSTPISSKEAVAVSDSPEKKSTKLWTIDTICSPQKETASGNSDSIKPSASKEDKDADNLSGKDDKETNKVNEKEVSVSCKEDSRESSCLEKHIPNKIDQNKTDERNTVENVSSEKEDKEKLGSSSNEHVGDKKEGKEKLGGSAKESLGDKRDDKEKLGGSAKESFGDKKDDKEKLGGSAKESFGDKREYKEKLGGSAKESLGDKKDDKEKLGGSAKESLGDKREDKEKLSVKETETGKKQDGEQLGASGDKKEDHGKLGSSVKEAKKSEEEKLGSCAKEPVVDKKTEERLGSSVMDVCAKKQDVESNVNEAIGAKKKERETIGTSVSAKKEDRESVDEADCAKKENIGKVGCSVKESVGDKKDGEGKLLKKGEEKESERKANEAAVGKQVKESSDKESSNLAAVSESVESNSTKPTTVSKEVKENTTETTVAKNLESKELAKVGKASDAEINLKTSLVSGKVTEVNMSKENRVRATSDETSSGGPSSCSKPLKDVEVNDKKNVVKEDIDSSQLKTEKLEVSKDIKTTSNKNTDSPVDKNLETGKKGGDVSADGSKSCEIKSNRKDGDSDIKKREDSSIVCTKSSEKSEKVIRHQLKLSDKSVKNLEDLAENKSVSLKSSDSKSIASSVKHVEISKSSSNDEAASQKDSCSIDSSKKTTKLVNNISDIKSDKVQLLNEKDNRSSVIPSKPTKSGTKSDLKDSSVLGSNSDPKSVNENISDENSLSEKCSANTSCIDKSANKEKDKTDKDTACKEVSSEPDGKEGTCKVSSEVIKNDNKDASEKSDLKEKPECKMDATKKESGAKEDEKSTPETLQISGDSSKKDPSTTKKDSYLDDNSKKDPSITKKDSNLQEKSTVNSKEKSVEPEAIGAAKLGKTSVKEKKTDASKEPGDKSVTSSSVDAKESAESKQLEETTINDVSSQKSKTSKSANKRELKGKDKIAIANKKEPPVKMVDDEASKISKTETETSVGNNLIVNSALVETSFDVKDMKLDRIKDEDSVEKAIKTDKSVTKSKANIKANKRKLSKDSDKTVAEDDKAIDSNELSTKQLGKDSGAGKKETDVDKKEIDADKKEIDADKKEIDADKKEIDADKKVIDVDKKETDADKKVLDANKKEIDVDKKETDADKKETDEAETSIEAELASMEDDSVEKETVKSEKDGEKTLDKRKSDKKVEDDDVSSIQKDDVTSSTRDETPDSKPGKTGRKASKPDAIDAKKPSAKRLKSESESDEIKDGEDLVPLKSRKTETDLKVDCDDVKDMLTDEKGGDDKEVEGEEEEEEDEDSSVQATPTRGRGRGRGRGRPRGSGRGRGRGAGRGGRGRGRGRGRGGSRATPVKETEDNSDNDTAQVSDKDEKPVSFSLSSFSLDVTDEPPPPAKKKPGRKRKIDERPEVKNSDDEDVSKDDDDDDVDDAGDDVTSSKRAKLKGKKISHKARRNAEEKARRTRKVSSSEEEGPPPTSYEDAFAHFVSKKNKSKHASKADKHARKKQTEESEEDDDEEDADRTKEEDEDDHKPRKKKSKKSRASRLEVELGISGGKSAAEDEAGGRSVRASRRIAQIKIKEQAERRQIEEATLVSLKEESKKKKKEKDKTFKTSAVKSDSPRKKKKDKSKKVRIKTDASSIGSQEEVLEKTKKHKKKKKHRPARAFDGRNPWLSTSDSSSKEEEEHFEIEEEEEEEEVLTLKSDHEFSPESDLECDDDQPIRRARTAQKGDKEEEVEDHACQKCSKADHPEWILLCDKCDNGWHASCLRPTLMVIPEGDWYCPTCQHVSLVCRLQETLKTYDKETKRRTNEELRRKRLAYVGISLDNVLSAEKKSPKVAEDESEGGSESSSAESAESEDDEPVYQLRQRRQAAVSYRFNEFDDLINSAIQDELEAVGGVLPIPNTEAAAVEGQTIDGTTPAVQKSEGDETVTPTKKKSKKKAERKENGEEKEKEDGEESESESGEDEDEEEQEDEEDEEEVLRVVPKGNNALPSGRKKQRKLNALDVDSDDDDHGSDEDFKGSSSEEEDDDLEDVDSDDSAVGRRYGRAVRRSSRTRTSRFDREFINDDSDSEESDAPKRKKTRRVWQESESEESDSTWGRRKKRSSYAAPFRTRTSGKKKKKKGKRNRKPQRINDSDEEVAKVPKPKKPKIKYGLDEPEQDLTSRRTRGRKMNYQEVVGSDTEEEILTSKKPAKKISDDEDEFKIEESDEEAKAGQGEGDGKPNATGKRPNKVYDSEYESGESSGEEEDLDDIGNSDEDYEEDGVVDKEGESGDEEPPKKGNVKAQKSPHKPISNVQNSAKDKTGKAVQTSNLRKEVNPPKVIHTYAGKRSVQTAKNAENVANEAMSSEEKKKDLLSAARFSTSTSNAVKKGLVGPPPLKIRVSKGGLATLTSPMKGEHSIPPPVIPESISKNLTIVPIDKSQTTVSEGLRQKLHNALTKKIRSQITDQRDMSEEFSDEEEEDMDEEISDFDEEDFDSGEDEAGKLDAPFTGFHHKDQRMPQKFPIVNAANLKQPPLVKGDDKDDKSAALGIRVISPLKLMPNPPMEQSRFPMPGHNPQMMRTMPPMVVNKMAHMEQHGGIEVSPPKRRGRGRGKKQLALEKAAQEQMAIERLGGPDPPIKPGAPPGGSVIRGMLQTGQPPHGFGPRPEVAARFPPKGRMPFPPVQGPPFPGNPRMVRPPYHRPLDPSPSGGGAVVQATTTSIPKAGDPPKNQVTSSQDKNHPPPPNAAPYIRPPGMRFPAPDSARPPLPHNYMPTSSSSVRPPPPAGSGNFPPYPPPHQPPPHQPPPHQPPPHQPPPHQPPPPSNYSHYSGYSGISNVDEPFMEPPQYAPAPESTPQPPLPPPSRSSTKMSGGEFGGLVSYFSSQREEDGLDT